jgi:hypothetical protein
MVVAVGAASYGVAVAVDVASSMLSWNTHDHGKPGPIGPVLAWEHACRFRPDGRARLVLGPAKARWVFAAMGWA